MADAPGPDEAAVEGLNMQKPGLLDQYDAVVDAQRRQRIPREALDPEKRPPVDQNRAEGREGARRPQHGKTEIR